MGECWQDEMRYLESRCIVNPDAFGQPYPDPEPPDYKRLDTCPDCGAPREKWDHEWNGDLDNPPAWLLDCDPERCANCGALLEDENARALCYRHHCQEFDKLPNILRGTAATWRTVDPADCELCQKGE